MVQVTLAEHAQAAMANKNDTAEMEAAVKKKIATFNETFLEPLNQQLDSLRQSNKDPIPTYRLRMNTFHGVTDRFGVKLIEQDCVLKKPWFSKAEKQLTGEPRVIATLTINPEEESRDIKFWRLLGRSGYSGVAPDLKQAEEIIQKFITGENLPEPLLKGLIALQKTAAAAPKNEGQPHNFS